MEERAQPLDLYAALGVCASAPQKEVETAFHRWGERRRAGEVCEEAFLRAESAYQVLADRGRRARYDRQSGRVPHPAWRRAERATARSLLRDGVRHLGAGRGAAALRLLERAAALAPEDPGCRSYLGLALSRSGGSLHEAARHAAYAVSACPREPAYLANLAAVYGAAGLRGRALRLRLRSWALLLSCAIRPRGRAM
jgi:Flp pilus assembly protein TadD